MNDSSNKTISYPVGGTAKRAFWGSFVTFLGQGINVLGHILLVPIFLWAWGSALYGEWLTLFSLAAYLSISDLGVGTYIQNKLTQAYSRSSLKEYAKILKSALFLYLLLAVFGLGLVLLVAFGLPFINWFDLNIADEQTARLTVLILGGYILLGLLFGPINGLYDSMGEFVRGKIIINIRELLLIGFVILTLIFGGGFLSVAFWYLALLAVFLCFAFWDATRRHKEIDLGGSKVDWTLAKSFIVPGLVYTLIVLAETITFQGSILVISSVIGSVAVATFGVHRTLTNLISRITTVVQLPLKPEITACEERKDYPKLQLIHNVFLKISLFLSLTAAAILMFTGGEIINIWTGGKITFHPVLWFILLATVPITSLWRFSSIFQISTNKYNYYAKVRLFSAIASIAIAVALVQPLGLVGVVLGLFVGEFIIGIWFVPKETLRIIKEDRFKFFKTLFGALLMFIVQFALAFVVSLIIFNVWLQLVVTGVLVTTAGLFYTYYIWADEKEKDVLNQFIRTIKTKFLKK